MDIVGLLLGLSATAAVATIAVRIGRRLYPTRPGARAVATVTVAWVAIVLCVQLTGAFGILEPAWLTVVAVAAAGVTWVATRRGPDAPPVVAFSCPMSRGLALVLVGVAVGAVVTSLLGPSTNEDALVYHYPMVAQWAQTHSLMLPRGTIVGYFTWFYPSNVEVLSLWSVIFVRSDALINLASAFTLLLTFGAVFALTRDAGRTLGMAKVTEAAPWVAIAWCAAPLVFASSLANSGVDAGTTGAFLVGTAFALHWTFVHGRFLGNGAATASGHDPGRGLGDLAMAGLGYGLALGAKYSAVPLVAVVVVAFVVLVAVRLVRTRAWGAVLVPVALAAGALALPSAFWYLRNVAVVGNPIYPGGILGMPDANKLAGLDASYKVLAHNVFGVLGPANIRLVGAILLGFGPLALFFMLAAVPAGVTLFQHRRASLPDHGDASFTPPPGAPPDAFVEVAAGAQAVMCDSADTAATPVAAMTSAAPAGLAASVTPVPVSGVAVMLTWLVMPLLLSLAWAATPETGFGPARLPFLFPLNLRYGMPAFAWGTVGICVAIGMWQRTQAERSHLPLTVFRVLAGISVAYTAAGMMLTDNPNVVPTTWVIAGAVAAGAVVAAGVIAFRTRALRRHVVAAVAATAAVVTAAAFVLGAEKFGPERGFALGPNLRPVVDAAIVHAPRPTCVVYSSAAKLTYPLYGPRYENRVIPAATEVAPGTFAYLRRPDQLVELMRHAGCTYLLAKDMRPDAPGAATDEVTSALRHLYALDAAPDYRAGIDALRDRFLQTPEAAWAAQMPGSFTPVASKGTYTLYRFTDDGECSMRQADAVAAGATATACPAT